MNIVVKSSVVEGEPGKWEEVKNALAKVFSKENLPSDFDYEIVSLGVQPYE